VIQAALCLGLGQTVNNGVDQECARIDQELTRFPLESGLTGNNPRTGIILFSDQNGNVQEYQECENQAGIAHGWRVTDGG